MEEPEGPKQRDVIAAPNVPRIIQRSRKSKRQAEKVLVNVNAIETRTKKGVKTMYDRVHQYFTSFFLCLAQVV
jgi:hypothetical protein